MALDVYELNDFQYVSMFRMANLESQLLMSVDSKDDDDEPTKARLTEQRQRCNDLVELGLVEDKTGDFIEYITKSVLSIGRGYRVFLITDIGRSMFEGAPHPAIN